MIDSMSNNDSEKNGINKQKGYLQKGKPRQLIFIDDSGDPGFKLESGSSRYFVIACVIFDSKVAAEAVMAEMHRLRKRFGWSKNHEFKFNKLRRSDLKATLATVAEYDFMIRAAIVDKTLVQSHELRTKPASFYNFIIKEVLEKANTIKDAEVRLDGHSDKAYRRQATTYFRKAINFDNRKIADFDMVDSKRDDLVQLADLVAGSIYHSLQSGKTDCSDYINLIKKRIDDLWRFE